MIELAEIGTRLGKHWLLAWEYAEAFRGRRDGTITAAKRLRIFKELAKLFESGIFEYDGKRYRTDPSKIMAALRTVCDADKYNFKNHNYLKKVLLETSERLSAEGLTAREEQKGIEGKKDRRLEGEQDEWPEGIEEIKDRLGVTKMSELIGKGVKNP